MLQVNMVREIEHLRSLLLCEEETIWGGNFVTAFDRLQGALMLKAEIILLQRENPEYCRGLEGGQAGEWQTGELSNETPNRESFGGIQVPVETSYSRN